MMNVYKPFFRRLIMLFVVLIGIFISQSVVAQTVKGKVTDAITGETLIGATVRVVELPGVGGVTNKDGEFSITECFLAKQITPSEAIKGKDMCFLTNKS